MTTPKTPSTKKKLIQPAKPPHEKRLAAIERDVQAIATIFFHEAEHEESSDKAIALSCWLSLASIIISIGSAIAQAFRLF